MLAVAGRPNNQNPLKMGILLKILANRWVPFHQGKVIGDGPEKIASLDVCVYQRVAGEDKGSWFSTNHGDDASRLQELITGRRRSCRNLRERDSVSSRWPQ